MNLKTKFKGKKVLLGITNLVISEPAETALLRKQSVIGLEKIVLTYVFDISKAKSQADFNKLEYIENYEFVLFGEKCDICNVFELYNEVAGIQKFQKYSKLWYDPKNATEITPISSRRFAP